MRVLVTGAAGFTGRHLCARLAASRDVDLVPAVRPLDLAEPAAVHALFARVRPDAVYHLAGRFSDVLDEDCRDNVTTTENVLEAARRLASGCRVLLVGSAAEYGRAEPHDNPVPETAPLRPASAYGVSKVRQTELMRRFAALGLEVVMARPFNLLGEGMSPRLVVGRVQAWIAARERGETARLTLGCLDARRDFLPVGDALSAYQRILGRGVPGEVYNVGAGFALPVRDVVHRLLTDRGLDPALIDEEPGRRGVGEPVAEIYADIRKLAQLPP